MPISDISDIINGLFIAYGYLEDVYINESEVLILIMKSNKSSYN